MAPQISNYMFKGVAGGLAVKIAGVVATFISSVLLARILGATAYGAYAYAITWANLLSIFGAFGTDTMATREIARAAHTEDSDTVGLVFWGGLYFALTLSTAISLAFSSILSLAYSMLDPSIAAVMWFVPIILPLLSIVRYCQGAALGLGLQALSQISYFVVLPTVSALGVLFMTFLTKPSAKTAMIIYFTALLAALGVFFALLRQRIDKPSNICLRNWRGRFADLGAIVGTNGVMAAAEQVPMLAVGSFLGAKESAIYDIARRISNLVALPILAANLPLAPAVVQSHMHRSRNELQDYVTRGVAFAFLISGAIVIGLFCTGETVLEWFGLQGPTAYKVLRILGVAQLAYVGMGSVVLLLNMTNNERSAFLGSWVFFMLSITFVGAGFVWGLGIIGAAMGFSLALFWWKCIMAFLVHKQIGVKSWVTPRGVFQAVKEFRSAIQ